jgi:hypothetical protein
LGKLGGLLLDRSWLAVSIIVIIVEDDDTFTRLGDDVVLVQDAET